MTQNQSQTSNRQQMERRALLISSYGALTLALLGVSFSVISGSEAIMLDGLFSALGFVMALLTLYVAGLIKRPDDDVFQYGYAHFAPLVNVLKSLVMTVLCGLALFSAIGTLMSGGAPMAVGSALVYALIATMIGLGLTLYLQKVASQTASVLVALDAKGARLDMMLSAAVLASFVLGWLALGTDMEPYLDYLDPLVVTGLCLVALPVPLKVLWDNGREVLLLAPSPEVQEAVKERIAAALEEFPMDDHRIRMLKMGNVIAVTLHLRPANDYRIEGVADLDRVRVAIKDSLDPLDYEVGLDVMFVSEINRE
jgi:cation diffusion facilitator family transporter